MTTTIGRFTLVATLALLAALSACAYESQIVCSPANPCPPPLPGPAVDMDPPYAQHTPDAAAIGAPTDAGTHD